MIKAVIRDVGIDVNFNVHVKTDYFNDDKVIQQGETRYSFKPNETNDQLIARIHADVDEHSKALISRLHFRNRNREALEAIKTAIVGHTTTTDRAEVKDPLSGQKLLLLKDGTSEAKDY